MKNKTILILGAGQIGEACAIRALRESPREIILHTLTEEEAKQVITNVSSFNQSKVKLFSSWGNALVTQELMHLDKAELHNKKNILKLINYYYSYLSNDLIKKSSLYKLIAKWKPDIIIDGINTATVVGYQDDPYTIPRRIIKEKNQEWQESAKNLLASNIVPSLIRFTQALKRSMADFKVESYIKISTTGLGGMGDNLFYTHGDVNEPGMSSGILGKVAAAGVIHQLFWSLSHTPGYNIKVIVPAALVGWQGVHFGKFRSHGRNIPLVDSIKRVKLKQGTIIKPEKCRKIGTYLEIPYVDSGENSAYSLGEMAAITALGQMECVTREEVAEAAIAACKGSTKHDLLTAMDLVALGPSHIAAIQRQTILNELRVLEKTKEIPSIATNNLGPTVSKHLIELFLLMKVSEFSVKKCITTRVTLLVQKIEQLLMSNNEIRAQIISLGLPIIFENGEVILGEYYYVPNPQEKNIVNSENIDLWASSGWVDVRKAQVRYWKLILGKVALEAETIEDNKQLVLNRNWQEIANGDTGELLGYIYSMLGGQRRTDFM